MPPSSTSPGTWRPGSKIAPAPSRRGPTFQRPPAWNALSTYKIDNGYRKLVSDAARLLDLRRRFGTYVHKR